MSQKTGGTLLKVIVWDDSGAPPVGDWGIVLWRSFGDAATPHILSIPKLVESNADVLRKRYLAWIYELGETLIGDRKLLDFLELRPGFSYWWMTLLSEKCNYGKSPGIDDAIRMMTFDKWATTQALCGVTFASANRPLAECMRLWCEKSGVEFSWQDLPRSGGRLSLVRRLYNCLPLVLQAWGWLIRYVVNRWPLRGAGLKEWQETEGRVTFVSYLFNLTPDAVAEGRFQSPFWSQLPETLQHEGCKTNWLHLYVKDGSLPEAGKAARAIRDFNTMNRGAQVHVTLDAFLTARIVLKALRDWFRIARVASPVTKQVSAITSEGLTLWPLFVTDWRQSIVGPIAMGNSLSLNLCESAMKSLPRQRIGVYLQENQGWEFGLVQAWKALGHGQIVGCPHSTIRYWDLRYFFDPRSYSRKVSHPLPLPDKIAVNGSAAARAYLAGQYPADGLREVEALRYLYLDGFNVTSRAGSESIKRAFRLLVLGDYLSRCTQVQMRLLEHAVVSMPAGLSILVKPHPACPINPEDYPRVPMTVTTAPIGTLLSESDVVYTSEMTSAAVEAYCVGLPVISVRDPNTLNMSPLRECEGVVFVSTPVELAHALNSASSTRYAARKKHEFFTVDASLPRWKHLLLENCI